MDFKNKPIFGMIHLSGGDSETILNRALKEIMILMDEGVDGIIIENYHGDTESVIEVLKFTQGFGFSKRGMYVGINILPNDFELALKLADEYGADFIQLDYVSGQYKPDIKIDGEKYIKAVTTKSNIKILGGVWPKYYRPVDGSNLEDDIEEALIMCDAIVVTGAGTGKETPLDKIKLFREVMDKGTRGVDGRKTPLIIGAGLDASNVVEQLQYADGAIVGSCFKPYKRTQEMISKELVKEFMDEVKRLRK
jgi:predicted TIM-barrel enzyme